MNAIRALIAAPLAALLRAGAAQARIFLDQVLSAAPDFVVQVAHFAGSGPGYDASRTTTRM
jgi:hypothetical protein